MNGSLFAMLLYLVLYLQNALALLGARRPALRLASSPAASLLTAIPAGRLSERIPVRWLIGPGCCSSASGCC